MSNGGYVAVVVIDLQLPDAGSLKAKRQQVTSLKAQLRTRLGVFAAETDHQDTWQRATFTAALVGPDLRALGAAADAAERFVLSRCPAGANFERHLVSVEDLRG
jgi:uncharacterized protein YlxP (DUF503 family)